MLTAKDSEVDKVVGLELGADDYVTKPYSSRELVARIKAVMRRGTPDDSATDANSSIQAAGRIRMDIERHQVTVNEILINLPLKEFELLEFLMRNSGRVLTRGQLIDRVWGGDYYGDTKTLDVHIKRLRSKIEIRGVGSHFSIGIPPGYKGRDATYHYICSHDRHQRLESYSSMMIPLSSPRWPPHFDYIASMLWVRRKISLLPRTYFAHLSQKLS
jgi:DNA-binding winged helix-turn-helix (wHTH) protein